MQQRNLKGLREYFEPLPKFYKNLKSFPKIKNPILIKTPLRYPGGKSKVVQKEIAPQFPDFEEFREAFLGGGSVFLHTRQLFPDKQYWINDLYPELYLLWLHAQKDIPGLLNQVRSWRRAYLDGKKLFRFLIDEMTGFSDLEKAAAFFILNRITFSGTTASGGYSEQAFQKRFTESSIDRLSKIPPLLEGVRITNFDYQKIVEAPGEDVFIFLDPPYFSATKSALYGKSGNLHKSFDHERFAKVMKNCQHQWLITYDDSPIIRGLFSFAKIKTWELTYGMRNVSSTSKQKASEIFISNY